MFQAEVVLIEVVMESDAHSHAVGEGVDAVRCDDGVESWKEKIDLSPFFQFGGSTLHHVSPITCI